MDLLNKYYEDIWNQWRFELADELLTDDFSFRGSLGKEIRGREAFKDYMRLAHDAFSDFHNQIERSLCSHPFVMAQLRYTGTHDGVLLEIPPTWKRISYPGVAIFRIAGERLTEGYVVGDRLTLLEQIVGAQFWLSHS